MTREDSKSPKVAYLTAGGAGMFCGSCMRDNTLAAALQRLGVDICLVPLYTPIRVDEENVSADQVFFGGINVYLQQKIPLFRYLPAILDRWLDRPWLLDRVSSWGIQTDGGQLGALAVSMLRGERGGQRKEVRRLVKWLAESERPELVNFSNILIAGSAPAIKARVRVPLVVTLQGDDLFLEDLSEPFASRAIDEARRLAKEVDIFLTFSDYYQKYMADRLEIPSAKFRRVPMGISLDGFPPLGESSDDERPMNRPPTIGFLARICPAKGFHLLVEAFLRLKTIPGLEHAQLRAAGWLGSGDRAFFDAQVRKLEEAGHAADFHYAGVVDRAEKIRFLSELDVFSAPTVYREPKGIFILEALAAGVPVVQPEHGAFPELLAATGGGKLVPPNDTTALAHAWRELLLDPRAARQLGARGQRTARAEFTAARMAERTLEIYNELAGPS